MDVMLILHSKKVCSDALEDVTSEIFSLASLAGFIPSFFCMTSALNILVMQFYKYLEENVTVPDNEAPSYICSLSYDSLKETLLYIHCFLRSQKLVRLN